MARRVFRPRTESLILRPQAIDRMFWDRAAGVVALFLLVAVTLVQSGPIEARARSAKSDPVGTRCRCTTVSVFMNTNRSGSSTAPTPLAQSATIASR